MMQFSQSEREIVDSYMDENVRSLGQTYGEFMDNHFKECDIDSDRPSTTSGLKNENSEIGSSSLHPIQSGINTHVPASRSLHPIQSGINTHGLASAVNARV